MSILHKTVDVVIPVYHAPDNLKELLNRLTTQSKPVSVIHVVNTQEEEEETPSFPEIPGVSVTSVSPKDFDHGRTRHEALLQSQADYVLFLTQDAEIVNDELVKELLMAFQDETVAVSYGRQLPKDDCRVLEAYSRSFNYPDYSFTKGKEDRERLGIKTYFCSDVCAMYDTKVFRELGGFVQKTIFNEDMLYAAKAVERDYRIAYVASAMVKHSHNYSGSMYLKRNFDLAVSQADHPEVFESVSSEKEGMSLVKKTVNYLVKQKKYGQIPVLFYTSGMKYIGYFLGKRYRKLPEKWILKLTSNKNYWGNALNGTD